MPDKKAVVVYGDKYTKVKRGYGWERQARSAVSLGCSG